MYRPPSKCDCYKTVLLNHAVYTTTPSHTLKGDGCILQPIDSINAPAYLRWRCPRSHFGELFDSVFSAGTRVNLSEAFGTLSASLIGA